MPTTKIRVASVKQLGLVAASLLATAGAQAALITSFENLDFDDTTANVIGGFDVAGNDVPGWTDNGPISDAGVETGSWWPTQDGYAAFMAPGDAAYTMSSHTIEAGEVYTIGFYGMQWQWTGAGEWTATLFYDDPANVIGSFTQGGLPDNGTWSAFSDETGIPATPASVGGTLGILVTSSGTGIAQIDEISVSVIPEPTAGLLALVAGLAGAVRRR